MRDEPVWLSVARPSLDAIAALVPFRPFEEPMILPLNKPRSYYGPGVANLGAGAPVGKI